MPSYSFRLDAQTLAIYPLLTQRAGCFTNEDLFECLNARSDPFLRKRKRGYTKDEFKKLLATLCSSNDIRLCRLPFSASHAWSLNPYASLDLDHFAGDILKILDVSCDGLPARSSSAEYETDEAYWSVNPQDAIDGGTIDVTYIVAPGYAQWQESEFNNISFHYTALHVSKLYMHLLRLGAQVADHWCCRYHGDGNWLVETTDGDGRCLGIYFSHDAQSIKEARFLKDLHRSAPNIQRFLFY